jgi:hypothetical protein
LLSAGPTTDKDKIGFFYPDYGDPAVRGMLVLDKGFTRWPSPPYEPPKPSIKTETVVEKTSPTKNAVHNAKQTSSTPIAASVAVVSDKLFTNAQPLRVLSSSMYRLMVEKASLI